MAKTKPKFIVSTGDPLIGRHFHSMRRETLPDGKEKKTIVWQGIVMGSPQSGYYLVQLYEWLMGEPNIQRLVKIEDMLGWQFYQNRDEMLGEWERDNKKNP